MVTWKSAERVVHFLRVAGASAALLELEARAVARSLRGELNRVINAEAAKVPVLSVVPEVVKEGDDYRLKMVTKIVDNDQDPHAGKCKMPN